MLGGIGVLTNPSIARPQFASCRPRQSDRDTLWSSVREAPGQTGAQSARLALIEDAYRRLSS